MGVTRTRQLEDRPMANPFVKGYPEYDSSAWMTSAKTGPDGTFRIVAFPAATRTNDTRAWGHRLHIHA